MDANAGGKPLPLVLVSQKCLKTLPPLAVRAYCWHWHNAGPQHPDNLTQSQKVVCFTTTGGEVLLGMGKTWGGCGEGSRGAFQGRNSRSPQQKPCTGEIACADLRRPIGTLPKGRGEMFLCPQVPLVPAQHQSDAAVVIWLPLHLWCPGSLGLDC